MHSPFVRFAVARTATGHNMLYNYLYCKVNFDYRTGGHSAKMAAPQQL